MYAILSGGALLALCDQPRYVKRHANGAYVRAGAEDAEGIAVHGQVYNLPGGTAIPGAPEAMAVRRDMAEFAFGSRARICAHEAATGAALAEIEGALCTLDTEAEERLTAIEEALCEMDVYLNGGES